ncbi:copper homeostasis membrane protein CopD [Ramlibacter agri]|nr:copper homeostasis membrane protein CopD [Ramlibacter agri]
MPVVRALHLAAIALLAGSFAFPAFVLPPSAAGDPERSFLRGWLASLRLWSTVVAVATWLAWIVAVAAGMSGLPLGEAWRPSVVGTVMVETRFGHVWLIRCALLVLLVSYLAWRQRRRRDRLAGADAVGAALASGVLVSQVWAGHATAAPPWHVVADAVHLVAAALWVGSLLPLLMVLARARAGAPAWMALADSATRAFSALGVLAVAALALTGFINGQMMVGSASALVGSSYGRLVIAKIVLFLGMVTLAAMNRWWLAPRMAPGHPQARSAARLLWRNVAVEIALGACILAAVGFLGGSEPPAHEPGFAVGGQNKSPAGEAGPSH